MSSSANGWRGHRGCRAGCQAWGRSALAPPISARGTRPPARPEEAPYAPACRAAGFALSARSASGDDARKVELGVGSEAEADGVRAAACAPPRRQGGDARLNIKVDPPLWAPARGKDMEPGPPPVASHLPWAGLTLTPKLRGSRGLHRGRCRLVNVRPVG